MAGRSGFLRRNKGKDQTPVSNGKSACVWSTFRFTTRPAPQVKDLRHGQLLYSSCTVGSGGLLRKLRKRIEPTIGLEPMTCRFQIGRLGHAPLAHVAGW